MANIGRFGIEIGINFEKASEVQKSLDKLLESLVVDFDLISDKDLANFSSTMKKISKVVDETSGSMSKGFENLNLGGLKEALKIIKEITVEQDKLDSAIRDNTFTSRKRSMSQKAGSVNAVLEEFVKEAGISKGIQSKVKAMIQDAFGNGTISEGFNEVVREELTKLDKDAVKSATKSYIDEFGEAFSSLKGKEVDLDVLSMILSKEEIEDFKTRTKGVIKLVTGTGEQIEQLLTDFNETYKGAIDLDGKVIQDQILELSKFVSTFKDIKKNGLSGVTDSSINEESIGLSIIEKYVDTIKKLEEIEIRRATKGGTDVDEDRLVNIKKQTDSLKEQYKMLSDNEKAMKVYFEGMGVGFDRELSGGILKALDGGDYGNALAKVMDKITDAFVTNDEFARKNGENMEAYFENAENGFQKLAQQITGVSSARAESIDVETESINKQNEAYTEMAGSLKEIKRTEFYSGGDTSALPTSKVVQYRDELGNLIQVTKKYDEEVQGYKITATAVTDAIEQKQKAHDKMTESVKREIEANDKVKRQLRDRMNELYKNGVLSEGTILDSGVEKMIDSLDFRSDSLDVETIKKTLKELEGIQTSITNKVRVERELRKQGIADALKASDIISNKLESTVKNRNNSTKQDEIKSNESYNNWLNDNYNKIKEFESKQTEVLNNMKEKLASVYDDFDPMKIDRIVQEMSQISVKSNDLDGDFKGIKDKIEYLKQEISLYEESDKSRERYSKKTRDEDVKEAERLNKVIQSNIEAVIEFREKYGSAINNMRDEVSSKYGNEDQMVAELTRLAKEVEGLSFKAPDLDNYLDVLKQEYNSYKDILSVRQEMDNLDVKKKAYEVEALARLDKISNKYGSDIDSNKLNELKGAVLALKDVDDADDFSNKVKMINASVTALTTEVDIYKDIKKQKQDIENLDVRKKAYEIEALARLDRMEGKYGSLVDASKLSGLRSAVTALKDIDDLDEFNNKIKMINAEMSELNVKAQNSGLKTANQDAKSFGDTLKDLATKLGVFRVVNEAWNLIERSFSDGVQSVKDLDSAFTTLKITMDGMSDSALNGMLDRAKGLATGLSATTSSVLEAVKTFANAQETIDSIMNKTSSAVILSNLTGLDTSRTVNIVQSSMQQFDALADGTEESAMRVADSMVSISRSLGMDFAQGISEMGEGIEIMGSLSNQLGMTLEDTLAMLASVMEKTRLSGLILAPSL